MSTPTTVLEDNDMNSQDQAHEVTDETAGEGAAARCNPDLVPMGDATRADKLVPVSEAKRYRKRAQAAEKILAELNTELAAKDKKLDEQQQVICDLQRRQQIDQLLVAADAIDLEAATVLTELALAEMDEPDVEGAVSELRRRKPFLFRSGTRGATTLGPKAEHDRSPAADALEHAAVEAHATGNRAPLLRYLRLRRRT